MDVNILEAIFIVAKAWRTKVTSQTSANCFRKGGFLIEKDVPCPDGGDSQAGEFLGDADVFEKESDLLKSTTSFDGDYNGYVACDENVEVFGRMTDEDIVEQ
jgi:hypothetical protein